MGPPSRLDSRTLIGEPRTCDGLPIHIVTLAVVVEMTVSSHCCQRFAGATLLHGVVGHDMKTKNVCVHGTDGRDGHNQPYFLNIIFFSSYFEGPL